MPCSSRNISEMLSEIQTMEKFDFLKSIIHSQIIQFSVCRGWSGGAMVLGKLPVPGRPTNMDYSRARAYCACSGCGWGLFGHLYSPLSFLVSFSPILGDGPI